MKGPRRLQDSENERLRELWRMPQHHEVDVCGMNHTVTVKGYWYQSSCRIVRNEMMGLDSMDAVK